MAEVDSMQDGSIAAMRQALREAIVAQGGQAAEGIKTWRAKVDVRNRFNSSLPAEFEVPKESELRTSKQSSCKMAMGHSHSW